jgi:hypothetical protein
VREGGREGTREGGREGGREGTREGGREVGRYTVYNTRPPGHGGDSRRACTYGTAVQVDVQGTLGEACEVRCGSGGASRLHGRDAVRAVVTWMHVSVRNANKCIYVYRHAGIRACFIQHMLGSARLKLFLLPKSLQVHGRVVLTKHYTLLCNVFD